MADPARRRRLTDDPTYRAHVARVVAEAPPLHPEVLARVALILNNPAGPDSGGLARVAQDRVQMRTSGSSHSTERNPPMEQPPLVRALQQLAVEHDLEGLRLQITQILDGVPEHERPHVPAHLATALSQFIDSYSTGPTDR